jgi:hypothetical protein
VSEKTENIKQLAVQATESADVLDRVLEELSGSSRRARQNAASVLAQIAKTDPAILADHIETLIEALEKPEAQTRWECLDALTAMVAIDSRACDRALESAEEALFDEDNGTVRLSALRFICSLGATTEKRSVKAWALLDEAIQCYHGDFEYQDMLIAITAFASGKLDPEVKKGLAERVAFDAEHGKGALQRRSQQILDNLA